MAIATAAPTSSAAGIASTYSAAQVISRRPIFLPRYSGVRPTIRPARNTATTASTSIPYSPAPTPPGDTSPSIMLSITTPPPPAVNESWKELTAPVEVPVVEAANSADDGMPIRTSLPSIAAPTASGTAPRPASSKAVVAATAPIQSTAMVASTA